MQGLCSLRGLLVPQVLCHKSLNNHPNAPFPPTPQPRPIDRMLAQKLVQSAEQAGVSLPFQPMVRACVSS